MIDSVSPVGERGATEIVGVSPAIVRAAAVCRRFAPTSLPMLLVGATGTGKELFARAIHAWSGRGGEFVDVNCGALPRELVEALLFGHRRGAFTGAVEAVRGMIEAAHGGTLFLDELCSLPLEAQPKLLRALETGEVRRVGDVHKHRLDFRLVAATQESVHERVSAGAFRPDLYHRVAGVIVTLPPLVDRPEDVPVLAHHFAWQLGAAVTPDALAVLIAQPWPGNARELRLVIQRAALLAEAGTLAYEHVLEALALSQSMSPTVGPVLPRGEYEQLLRACAISDGSAEDAARHLGVSRATLFRRLKAQGLSFRQARQSQRLTESHRS